MGTRTMGSGASAAAAAGSVRVAAALSIMGLVVRRLGR
jgi:hypothetical protein